MRISLNSLVPVNEGENVFHALVDSVGPHLFRLCERRYEDDRTAEDNAKFGSSREKGRWMESDNAAINDYD